ncbi:hypothetical protein [Staphylococcus phage SAP6]|nr:hypothetical protein SAP1_031 [Staphylococcus phage StAP1]QXV86276.1 hypothetical protein [Staphylococcus phage SAPYZU_15]UGL60689.1 group I intron protein [Staphylococcus phage vB_SauM-HM01]WAW12144.1 hypothetical protein [Staphylococcus phage SAP6]BEU75217.1 HNH endonuclease [Staphylococcus phage phiRNIID]
MVYDNEWFINRIKDVRPEDYEEYEFLDDYVNQYTKLRAIHKKCGNKILITPSTFMSKRKTGCNTCSQKRVHSKQRKTHEEYQKELPEGIMAITKYEGAFKKITLHCFFCDSTYTITARDILKYKQCSRCNRRFNRTLEDIKFEVRKETKGNYEVVSNHYKNAHTPIEIKHNECGKTYRGTMANFRKGRRCSHCRNSIGEKLVESYLEQKGITYEKQKTFEGLKLINNLSYDFYLPEYNLLIEYQGEQHVKPVKHFGGEEQFKLQKKIDSIKSSYAKDNGYELFEIFYTTKDYKSIEKLLNNKLFYS